MTTTEGNKLIAEFMGWDDDNDEYPDGLPSGTDVWGYFLDNEIKYHTSFDWQMPVVEKIRSLGWRIEIYLTTVDCSVHITKGDERLNIAYYSKLIEAVWHAVIQFIQWFNNQSK